MEDQLCMGSNCTNATHCDHYAYHVETDFYTEDIYVCCNCGRKRAVNKKAQSFVVYSHQIG